jgi:hypothetical protein
MLALFAVVALTCAVSAQVDISKETGIIRGDGSYNSFREQVGFCKLQNFNTVSRGTSGGPKMFLDGRVWIGVGMAAKQFENAVSNCGRCLRVLKIKKFYQLSPSLTRWNYSIPARLPFTAFIMDECTDEICKSGFLDFDVYNLRQPVAYGNPTDIEWEWIPCPVRDDKIELLMCLGTKACIVSSPDKMLVSDMLAQAGEVGYMLLYVRSARTPIVSMTLKVGGKSFEFQDNQGWYFSNYDARLLVNGLQDWTIVMKSDRGIVRSFKIHWPDYANRITDPGYRGGFILDTGVQV